MSETIRNISIAVSVLTLVFAGGCKKKEVRKQEEKVIRVEVHEVAKRPLMPYIEAVGTLNAYDEVIISSEVDGILKSVKVEAGTQVRKGQLLATINDVEFDLEVNRGEALLRQAEANLLNIQLEHERKSALIKDELITKQQFDDVSTRLTLAQAEVDKVKATLLLAKEKYLKTKIFSPISGVVKEKKVTRGDFVRNGTPLISIIRINPIKITFTVPEKYVGLIKVGQDVSFKVDAFPKEVFKGKLTLINPSLDEKTRTITVEAQSTNPKARLAPGFFANVILYTGKTKEIVTVPITSLFYEGETVKVFVVKGGIAKERIVKIGNKYEEKMEILDGIKKGELVVTVGQQNLSDGVKVNVAR